MTQKRVTAVPDARIGPVRLASGNRGEYQRAVSAVGQQAFDEALTDLLNLPRPERAPPGVSRRDR